MPRTRTTPQQVQRLDQHIDAFYEARRFISQHQYANLSLEAMVGEDTATLQVWFTLSPGEAEAILPLIDELLGER